jgi:hypothetical protein
LKNEIKILIIKKLIFFYAIIKLKIDILWFMNIIIFNLMEATNKNTFNLSDFISIIIQYHSYIDEYG